MPTFSEKLATKKFTVENGNSHLKKRSLNHHRSTGDFLRTLLK